MNLILKLKNQILTLKKISFKNNLELKNSSYKLEKKYMKIKLIQKKLFLYSARNMREVIIILPSMAESQLIKI